MEPAILEREALRLPESQRALLADRLLQSLGLEDEETLKRCGEEAERRLDAYRRGQVQAVDGPEAVRRLRDQLE